MTIKLGPGVTFPDDVVTQTIGILAKRGAGKSNAATVLAEEMFRAGLPFVVVDPVGAWWGLRATADGKPGGIPVPIFGGHRGDRPLEPTSGRLMAELIVEHNMSAILDVSDFDSEAAKRRFLADFAERLFTLKGKPGNDTPLHLFLEEADDYIPQRPNRDSARTLGAFERIVKRGRARGLGATMITQRSASINKDVLTQIETLIVLRIVSPTDRKPIEEWVKYHGQKQDILETLQVLAPGEAWVWSMWLDLTQRTQIRRRRTFDSGATPDVKAARRAVATLGDVDLDAISTAIADTVERAKADDPKELRAQIAKLRVQLKLAEDQLANSAPAVERVIEVPVEIPRFTEAQFERLVAIYDKAFERLSAFESREIDARERLVEALAGPIAGVVGDEEEIHVALERLKGLESSVGKQAKRALPAAAGRGVAAPATPAAADPDRYAGPSGEPGALARPATSDSTGEPVRSDSITQPQQRILDAIAWLASVGIEPAARLQVAMIAGYHPRTKGFTNSLGSMSSGGLVHYPTPGFVAFTDAGRELAQWPERTASSADLQEAVYRQVGAAKTRFLQELVRRYPDPVSRDELAATLEYHPRTKGFTNSLGSLRTLGLIEYPQPGYVVAARLLFLEEAA